jgi:hypothetical protein
VHLEICNRCRRGGFLKIFSDFSPLSMRFAVTLTPSHAAQPRAHAAARLANASSRDANSSGQACATQIGHRIDMQVVNGRRRWQRSCVTQQPITAQVHKRDEVARSAAVAQLAA